MKKLVVSILCILALLLLASCSLFDDIGGSGGGGGSQNGSAAVGWPKSVYDGYGIPEISTNGKIVYYERGDSSYQYEAYYADVTREELKAWTDTLLSKGFRATDLTLSRLDNTYDYEQTFYMPGEGNEFRLKFAFDFGEPMDFEYYGEESEHPGVVLTEREEYGEVNYYVVYNFKVWLNPMKTESSFTGSNSVFGFSADELKFSSSLRSVTVSDGGVNFYFYSDHLTTAEEIDLLRTSFIDKLAEKGVTFEHTFGGEKTAEELKEEGIGSYVAIKGENKYQVMVNPDSSYGDFGDGYYLIFQKVNY